MHTQVTLQQIKTMFSQIATNAGWDMNSDKLWSYFFYDEDKSKLETFSSNLKKRGYNISEITSMDDGRYKLTVKRKEVHNPTSLLKRHKELIKIANENNVDHYDGFDVGPGNS